MPSVQANGISIEYQTHGHPEDPALLLIMGLGGPLILWEESLCNTLADQGFFVVRYDNRDCGHSTKMDSHPTPDGAEFAARWLTGEEIEASYTLTDMARDGIALLDALGIGQAHVAGTSLGGMIAQTMAIEFPQRVSTLISIMSSTGERSLSKPSPEAMAVLLTPAADTREAACVQHLASNRAIGGDPNLFPYDEARLTDRASRLWDYGIEREGATRQLLAGLASGDRTAGLRELSLPALIIHGTSDTLFGLDHGKATFEAIPGAKRIFIEGFGHDLHPGADEILVREITALCRTT
ncbi:MAG: alpha/beta hydrolase [Myxococcota bacterium]|jgi:pimeloyl-ACP methyl ester carboxylesterase|nr:alpha/beta hydrolase [Myxococcota bacterium]